MEIFGGGGGGGGGGSHWRLDRARGEEKAGATARRRHRGCTDAHQGAVGTHNLMGLTQARTAVWQCGAPPPGGVSGGEAGACLA